MLLLYEFTFSIVVRPKKSHVSANHLSRVKLGDPFEGVNDNFLDAHLFWIAVLLSWYTNIREYLSAGQFSREMQSSDKRKLVLNS